MPLLLPFLVVVGLFLPGLFIARGLKHKLWGASAFLISLPILFHTVFWLGISGAPIALWSVLPCLLAVTAGAAWFARKAAAGSDVKTAKWVASWPERILVLSSVMVGGILIVRSAVSPLIGYDTRFRWDFLAARILELQTFDFYPPVTVADLRTYFLVDGIPPMVSFVHWFLYASAGEPHPWLITVFIAAQFACTLAFTYGAASLLFSRQAGIFAAAILAASPLYFRAAVIGQETGLTALAIAATIYFIACARKHDGVRAMVSAGIAAGLCALSREYGWIALVIGLVALVWRREHLQRMLVFAGMTLITAFPWYARSWILTGNPFYPLRLGDLAVNPVYDGLLQYNHSLLNVMTWGVADWAHILYLLVLLAPIQLLGGIGGAVSKFREHGYLVIVTLLLAAVWIQAAGYTSGGPAISTRVLSPAVVVLSILGAGALEPLMARKRLHAAAMVAILACQAWTGVYGAVFPEDPLSMSISQWKQSAFKPAAKPVEFQICDELVRMLPADARVLSDNAYLHAALVARGIEVVPVWSPEVDFLFSASVEEAEKKLQALGITSVAYYPQSLNTPYLASISSFYASLPKRWHVLAQIPGFLDVFVPRKGEWPQKGTKGGS